MPRALPRLASVVLVVSCMMVALAAVAISRGPAATIALRAGGRPPPPPSLSGAVSAPVSVPASSPGSTLPDASVSGPADPGAGGTVEVGSAGTTAPAPDGPPRAARTGRAVTAAAAAVPSRHPSAPPPPPPAASPQPPGLGARLLPGLAPLLAPPGHGHPDHAPPSSGTRRYPSGSTGYDISWPQCGQSYPPKPYVVAIVGVNDGQAFSTNPCLDSEASWAGSGINLYANLNSPTSVDETDQSGPAGRCRPGDDACLAYNYGYNAAANSVTTASDQGVGAPTWWLDVETAGRCATVFPTNGTGYWSCDTSLNARTIQGAIDALRGAGVTAGDYSTSYQWGVITGGYVPTGGGVPNWIAGADPSQTSSWCSGSHDFGGGQPWLIQLATSGQYDEDEAC